MSADLTPVPATAETTVTEELRTELLTGLTDPLTPAVAVLAGRQQPGVLERLVEWEPVLEQRGLTTAQWEAYAPLVRAAVVCAGPSNPKVAGDMATNALSVIQHAAERRIPLRLAFVFRSTTVETYLKSVSDGSRRVIGSRLNAIVAGVGAATELDPAEPPAADDAAGQDAEEPAAGGQKNLDLSPLLLDQDPPTRRQVRQLGMHTREATELLDALALVRIQVKAVEPTALRRQEARRGGGPAVPYGDVELLALLAAADTHRTTKQRIAAKALIGLGAGAGVVAGAAAAVTGGDVVEHDPELGGPGVIVDGQLRPLHVAFAPLVIAAARHAGADGFVIGGGKGDRRNRPHAIAAGLAGTDPHLVRLTSPRLLSTWLAGHLTLGVPLGDLLDAAGWTSATPLDAVLPYLPRRTPAGRTALTGHRHTAAPTPAVPAAAAAPAEPTVPERAAAQERVAS